MNREILKFDLVRLLPWWLPAACGLWWLVLTEPAPLEAWNGWLLTGSATLGIVSAWRLFEDPHATRTYLFTRGLSRRRLFWNRWALGMAGIAVVTLEALLLVIAGIRGDWAIRQQSRNALYYPMIRDFELTFVWPLVAAAAFTFCLTTFVVVRRGLRAGHSTSMFRDFWRSSCDLFALIVILLATFVAADMVADHGEGMLVFFWTASAPIELAAIGWTYLAIGSALATWGAAHAYRNLEVSA